MNVAQLAVLSANAVFSAKQAAVSAKDKVVDSAVAGNSARKTFASSFAAEWKRLNNKPLLIESK